MVARTSGGMPQSPAGGGSIAPPISPCHSTKEDIDKAPAIERQGQGARRSGLSKGGASCLTSRLVLALLGTTSQITAVAWLLTSFITDHGRSRARSRHKNRDGLSEDQPLQY